MRAINHCIRLRAQQPLVPMGAIKASCGTDVPPSWHFRGEAASVTAAARHQGAPGQRDPGSAQPALYWPQFFPPSCAWSSLTPPAHAPARAASTWKTPGESNTATDVKIKIIISLFKTMRIGTSLSNHLGTEMLLFYFSSHFSHCKMNAIWVMLFYLILRIQHRL